MAVQYCTASHQGYDERPDVIARSPTDRFLHQLPFEVAVIDQLWTASVTVYPGNWNHAENPQVLTREASRDALH